MKIMNKFFLPIVLCFGLFFMFSCEKESTVDGVTSNDGSQARKAYTGKGYTEVEVSPIVKSNCYFQEWDKEVLTPVSGIFEYHDSDNNWVASIDFGNGSCDQWATKTWDVNMFPDYPSGTEDFSVFDYKPKN
jgi:hypothetical protein